MNIQRGFKVLCLTLSTLLPMAANAAAYIGVSLAGVTTDVNGVVYLRWAGYANPGPCGANAGWVKMESTADPALKSLAYSLYIAGKTVRVDTAGCSGTYEIVTAIEGQ